MNTNYMTAVALLMFLFLSFVGFSLLGSSIMIVAEVAGL